MASHSRDLGVDIPPRRSHRHRPVRTMTVLVGAALVLAPLVSTATPAQAGGTTTFTNSFEDGEQAPYASHSYEDPVNVTAPAVAPPASAMVTEVDPGPVSSPTAKTEVGFTGLRTVKYAGAHLADGAAKATNTLFDTAIALDKKSELTYKIFPALDDALTFDSTYVAVDLAFSDGTRLSETDAVDSTGYPISPRGQGADKVLAVDQWNSVHVDLGAFAGKTVTRILLAYDNPNASAKTTFTGWLDDVSIADAVARDTSDGLVSYVDTRRGTNSSGDFSRGNNIPAATWPNGFNFWTPVTDADAQNGTQYSYQQANDANNLPTLEGIEISHVASVWIGDRNQLTFTPSTSADPDAGLGARALEFSHTDEIARPDLYQVTTRNGITAAVTPTDHAGVLRFTYPGKVGSVIVDRVNTGDQRFSISPGGVLSGWTENGSWGAVGRSRMFVYGTFDRVPAHVGPATRGDRSAAQVAAFDTSSDKDVELSVATSFISLDQAKKNLSLEVGAKSFDQVHKVATKTWNDRLGAVSVSGATDGQRESLYSSLYRMNMYPNSQFENTGTAAHPVYRHASPVAPQQGQATDTKTNAKVVDGLMYVNNGFWDTYRTLWPLYSYLYPNVAADLVDGFVQQYREGGWVARWSGPGYNGAMTGTSSDVAFAEAYMAGALPTDKALDTLDAAVKNATVLPDVGGVGRDGMERSVFLGYTTPDGIPQSVSWGLEGFINDWGIGNMAAKLAKDPKTPKSRVAEIQADADYFLARSNNYVNMFNPDKGFFTERNADGTFPDLPDFDPTQWKDPYTESNAWNFAFHAPFDPDGLAALYGGTDQLLSKLDTFFTTPTTQGGTMHEQTEARDWRLGQLVVANQVAHHIPYMYAAAGEPAKTQEIVRDITKRLFNGSDIGQGYPGDEDNGEFSSWYVFSVLGFYPLQVGSGNYTVGSPLFDKVVIRREGHQATTITADGASAGKRYVAGVSMDGKKLTSVALDGDTLRSAKKIAFTMSAAPTDWGNHTSTAPVPTTLVDATTSGYGSLTSTAGDVIALTDNNSRTTLTVPAGTQLTWTSANGPVVVGSYTLTDATGAKPTAWTLEGSNDGTSWKTLDQRTDEKFAWATQTRPFEPSATGAFTRYRLTIDGTTPVNLAEIELFAAPGPSGDLKVNARTDVTAKPGEKVSDTLATVTGAADLAPDDVTVTVDFLDGKGPQAATVTTSKLGGLAVSAPHTFAEAGVYDVLVSAQPRAAKGANPLLGPAPVSGTSRVTVGHNESLTASYNQVCLGDLGTNTPDCDGNGISYDRAKLAATGFVQGTTITVPGTDLTFDLPRVEVGRPDNLVADGQTIAVDAGTGAHTLSVIGTATGKDMRIDATLTFSDGSTQPVPIGFSDWVGGMFGPKFGSTVVASSAGRINSSGDDGQTAGVYASAPIALPEGKTPLSLTFPKATDTLKSGGVHVFAIASDGDRSAGPLTVSPLEVPGLTTGRAATLDLATVTGGGDPVTATVNWGDGTGTGEATLTPGHTSTDHTVSATHTYATAGTYPASVSVDDGLVSSSAQVTITVTDPPVVYHPQLSVPSGSVAPGATVSVAGTGFAPTEDVRLTLATTPEQTATVAADAHGTLNAQLTVPAAATAGTYPVTAVGTASATPATADVTVSAPVPPAAYLRFSATRVHAGDTDQVTGGGFSPAELVTLAVPNASTTLAQVVADAQGSIAADVTIPPLTPGDYVIAATGAASKRTATATVSVVKADPALPAPSPTPAGNAGDHAGRTLPWTGSNVVGPLVGAGALILLGLAGLIVVLRRRARGSEGPSRRAR